MINESLADLCRAQFVLGLSNGYIKVLYKRTLQRFRKNNGKISSEQVHINLQGTRRVKAVNRPGTPYCGCFP